MDEELLRPEETTGQKVKKILLRTLIIVLVTLLLLVGLLYSAMFVICRGPSPMMRDLFVRTVRETSAIGFLADLYLSPEEIAAIEAGSAADREIEVSTDVGLVEVSAPADEPNAVRTDAWGYSDEDGDGLILADVKGESYAGYMLIVLDPSRVVLGCVPSSLGVRGYTVQEFVEYYDAVAGINGGGFADPNGQGNGSMPDTLVVKDGQASASASWGSTTSTACASASGTPRTSMTGKSGKARATGPSSSSTARQWTRAIWPAASTPARPSGSAPTARSSCS